VFEGEEEVSCSPVAARASSPRQLSDKAMGSSQRTKGIFEGGQGGSDTRKRAAYVHADVTQAQPRSEGADNRRKRQRGQDGQKEAQDSSKECDSNDSNSSTSQQAKRPRSDIAERCDSSRRFDRGKKVTWTAAERTAGG
jgi:hypothetical protein